MSGFTKGPWAVDGGCRATGFTVKIASGELLVGGAGLTSEANARLIAASPTMYESLVKAEELFSFHEGSAKPEFDGAHPTVRINGEDFAILLADIRAALSKAAGEGV